MSDLPREGTMAHSDGLHTLRAGDPHPAPGSGSSDIGPGHKPHEFPPTTNPGIYWCRHCGLITARRSPDPCPALPAPIGV
jgi:rubrerythrin